MKFLVTAGLIMFAGSIILLVENYDIVEIDKKGSIVKMRIEKLPGSCIGSKVRYFVTYSYNGELYEKATRGSYCQDHYVGELVDMKYLEGNKRILHPRESSTMELMLIAGLALIGLTISITQWLKLRSHTSSR